MSPPRPSRLHQAWRLANTAGRGVLALGLVWAMAACHAGNADDTRSSGMFGLFKNKTAAATGSTAPGVAPQVGAALQPATRFPSELPSPTTPAWAAGCQPLWLTGQPPQLQTAPQAVPGQTQLAWRLPGVAGQAEQLLLNRRDGAVKLELWALSGPGTGTTLNLGAQRPLNLGAEQAKWASYRAQDLRCLPQGQRLLVLHYASPAARHAVYTLDPATATLRRLAERVEANPYAGLPQRFADVLPLGPQAALVLFHTDALRLAPEVYANRLDHLWLFSPQHPQGLPLLTLDIAQGNVRQWALQGQVLHLETIDPREQGRPKTFFWTLDLARVL